jgi:hypothetical protein
VAEFANIAELPQQFASLARDFRASAAALVRNAMPDLVQSRLAVPPMLLLREATVTVAFSIVAESQRVILFVFRRGDGEVVVLDTSIQFRIAPAVFTAAPVAMQTDAIAHFSVLPPFFVRSPSPVDIREFTEVLGVTPELMLQISDGALAMACLDSPADARVAWRASNSNSASSLRPGHPDPASMRAFLSLAQSIGQWVSQGFDQGEEVPLDTGALAARAPAIREILERLCEGWTGVWNETAVATYAPSSLLDAFHPGFSVEDYTGSVQLRLNADGTVATSNGQDTFQLLLKVQVSAPNGVPRSRISVGPPDFLVSGQLHSSFLAALHGEKGFSETAALLGVNDPEEQVQLSSFLLACLPSALVFRVTRGKPSQGKHRDLDLVIYSGDWNGEPASLVLSAEFLASSDPQVPADYVAGTQRVVYSSLAVGARIQPQPVLAAYCIRLFASMRNWLGVVQG